MAWISWRELGDLRARAAQVDDLRSQLVELRAANLLLLDRFLTRNGSRSISPDLPGRVAPKDAPEAEFEYDDDAVDLIVADLMEAREAGNVRGTSPRYPNIREYAKAIHKAQVLGEPLPWDEDADE